MNSTIIVWQDEPDFRGTYTILTSCMSTLLLCVWSALHLDIPGQGESKLKRHMSKTGWLIIGLLAPELLLWVAFQELQAACSLTLDAQEVLKTGSRSSHDPLVCFIGRRVSRPQKYFEEKELVDEELRSLRSDSGRESPSLKSNRVRKHPWTLAHSFYAIMGGFVLQEPHPDPKHRYLPCWQRNGVLTAAGIRFLLEHDPDLIPDLSLSEIKDRSKEGGMEKAILVWQVIWFILDCLNRLAQGLPLSLLEVSTIAHALCALLTCAMWWKKPKDVSEPTVIENPHARPLGAWMSMASKRRRYVFAGHFLLDRKSEGSLEIAHTLRSETSWSEVEVSTAPWMPTLWDPLRTYVWPWLAKHVYDRLVPLQPSYGALCQFNPDHTAYEEDAARSRRKALAQEASEQYSLPRPRCESGMQGPFVAPVAHLQEATFALALTEIQWEHKRVNGAFVVNRARLRMLLLIAVLTATYGFPHILGWHADFGGGAIGAFEQTLWRAATVTVMVSGLILDIVFYLVGFLKLMKPSDKSTPAAPITTALYQWAVVVSSILVPAIPLLYIATSTYLLAESFRQLFALPAQAFELASWGNYWPHFS
ncbi:hypothetical protein C8Q74DRAFT_272047 [Fomes fomentarius]|nr:hypothetical protein C8Q74DRAFT_272047 [Fomes fomentarius]